MKPQTVVFFGRSGAGKGTQAKLLIDYLKERDPERAVLYVEPGQEFRVFAEQSSYTSGRVREVMGQGGLMPIFLPVWIWSDYLIKNYTGDEHLIFDGICRRKEEAPAFDSAMDFYGRSVPSIIHLDVGHDRARTHLMNRGREDDTEANITRRLSWYDSDVVPTLEHFKNNSQYAYHDIAGERTIEEVHQDIIDALF